MAEVKNGTVTITGIEELEKKLTRMRTDDPTFEKRLRGAIREILMQARKELSGDAQTGLQMQSDPRSAYKAVRSAVYKRIFGGQVNILQSRRAGAMKLYEPPRKLREGKRGGNRMPRGKRTEQLMSYQGKDRGFVLRFLNQGTTTRTSYGGNRGAISARNWFGGASQREMQDAAGKLQTLIDRIINDEFV